MRACCLVAGGQPGGGAGDVQPVNSLSSGLEKKNNEWLFNTKIFINTKGYADSSIVEIFLDTSASQ